MTDKTDWTGRTGEMWAAEWRRTDRSFAALTPQLDAAILSAAPAGRFRALDIGCGAGATAHALAAARPDAEVTGVDLSQALVAIAAERFPLPNLCFLSGDAIVAATALAPVDLYVSRHGIMFFDDPAMAFTALAHAAAPGACLVFSCFAERRANRFAADLLTALGQDGEALAGEAPGPFAFADPVRVGAMLADAGWTGEPARVDFRYRAAEDPKSIADAVDFFTHVGVVASLLRNASDADRPAMREAIASACARRRHDGMQQGAVDFAAVSWLWSATLKER